MSSTFECPVVVIENLIKHDNADNLSIVKVFGTIPCIVLTSEFKIGDLAVYIPEDSLLPLTNSLFAKFKKDDRDTFRLRAIRLRGVYSEGLLVHLPDLDPDLTPGLFINDLSELIGRDFASYLGIEKYEQPEHNSHGPNAKPKVNVNADSTPRGVPRYDMENYQKYSKVLDFGEEVWVSEKIHGCTFVAMVATNPETGVLEFKVGSHNAFWKRDPASDWWALAIKLDLEKKLAQYPDYAFYGEMYGNVQDLKYGVSPLERTRLRLFDIWDNKEKRWLDFEEFIAIVNSLDLPRVPILYEGLFIPSRIEPLRSGQSTLHSGTIREGIVIKAKKERWIHATGRAVLKLVSEEYKLRKNGTEGH